MNTVRYAGLLVAALLFTSTATEAHAQAAPSTWEALSPAQRDALVAPVRDRYNSAAPAQQQRMLQHGQRWQAMTPAQRDEARKGMRRFEGMNPEQREQARALFEAMRGMAPAQRDMLRQRWAGMDAGQRRQWVRDNPAPPPPPPRKRD